MMFIDNDGGTCMYMVCNDVGLCLIRTTNSYIARYVEIMSKGRATDLRLNVGGDPGTKRTQTPAVFHHTKRYR